MEEADAVGLECCGIRRLPSLPGWDGGYEVTVQDHKMVCIGLVSVIFISVIGAVSFVIKRKVNYRFGYEKMVRDTVREMVKAEALK